MKRVVPIVAVPATVVAELVVAAVLVLAVHAGQGESPSVRTIAWQAFELYVALIVVLAVWDYGERVLRRFVLSADGRSAGGRRRAGPR